MESDGKIASIRSLLTAFEKRKKSSGIAWAEAFNDEQAARETIDPSAEMYDKRLLTAASVRKKISYLPPVSDMNQAAAEKAVSMIATKALCKLDGLLPANTHGCVEALFFIASKYPEVTEFLKCYSSVKGTDKRNKEDKKKYIEKIKDDQESANRRVELQKWLDGYQFEGRNWGSANNMASTWGVKNRKPVKDWIAKNGQWTKATEELLEICKAARLENEMNKYLSNRADDAVEGYLVPDEENWTACASRKYQSVYISSKYGSKRDYEVLMKDSEASGFHPKRDPEHHGSKAVMVHELGHVMDYMTDAREDSIIKDVWNKHHGKDLKKELSKYGDYSIAEMIAEAFAEYSLCKEPRPIAKTIGERIEERYKNKFGTAHLA